MPNKHHSVDRDVSEFCGWDVLLKICSKAPSVNLRDLIAVDFLVAGRISEALCLRKKQFHLLPKTNEVRVDNYEVLKRWRGKDYTIECKRCFSINDKFQATCQKCGANLVFGGKKHFVTERLKTYRLPFYFPMNEPITPYLIHRLKVARDLLFESPYTGRPYTRQWADSNIAPLGRYAVLDRLYFHWLRSQRMMCLGNEYGFDDMELKAFTGLVKSETVSRYAKKVKSYRQKLGRIEAA